MIQMIDVSAEVLYDFANAEKKLNIMINAFVSHEIRNPLNSIRL